MSSKRTGEYWHESFPQKECRRCLRASGFSLPTLLRKAPVRIFGVDVGDAFLGEEDAAWHELESVLPVVVHAFCGLVAVGQAVDPICTLLRTLQVGDMHPSCAYSFELDF